jgi:glycosyltransferase involved in cell wall biosynthesis
MTKIAYIIKDLGIGGAEVSTLTLIDGFKKLGINVDLIVLYGNKTKWENNKNFNITYLNVENFNKNLFRNKIIEKKLEKLFIKNNYDAILTCYTSKSGERIFKNLVKKYNFTFIVRNSFSNKRINRSKLNIFRQLKKKYLIKTYSNKKIICISNGVYNDLTKNIGIDSKKIKTIYNPFDLQKIISDSKNDIKINIGDEYIINVARYVVRHKGQDILLHAYKKANIKEKLVLLGEGKDEEYLKEIVKKLEIEDKVVFIHSISNPYPLIKNAKLLVLSSNFEGLGRVLVEALALKTPVVSTDCESGPSEILTGKLSQFLVPVGDIDALANKIKCALTNYPEIKEEYFKKFEQLEVCKQYLKFLGLDK